MYEVKATGKNGYSSIGNRIVSNLRKYGYNLTFTARYSVLSFFLNSKHILTIDADLVTDDEIYDMLYEILTEDA